MKNKNKNQFCLYFLDCNCQENKYKNIRGAIDHLEQCDNSSKITYRSLYDQIFDNIGIICYPYNYEKN